MGWFCQDFFQEFSRRMRVLITSEQIITESVVQSCSVKNVFVEISQNSQENTWARVSFLITLQAPATLLKKRLWLRCFPMHFVKFLRVPYLENTSGGSFYWRISNLTLKKRKVTFLDWFINGFLFMSSMFMSNQNKVRYLII